MDLGVSLELIDELVHLSFVKTMLRFAIFRVNFGL